MTPTRVPLEVWADEGRRTAPAFADVAAAIVTGRDAEAAAAVALGIARACAQDRRVAVADLVGGIPSLRPLDEQPGLLECLRDGTPISDIGQPLLDAPDVYILPSGGGPIAERWVFESARWDRLVAGFREVDALLLLVAPAAAPGLDLLIGRVDGVVAVDLPPAMLRSWPLIATVDEPEQELPEIAVTPREQAAVPPTSQRPKRRLGRWLLAGTAAALAALYWSSPTPAPAIPTPEPLPLAEVEVALGPLVNPGDSAIALRFSVELVAANTPVGANSVLQNVSDRNMVRTVSPVVLQPGTSPWYRALVGAFATREWAQTWIDSQRELGVLRPNIGRILDVPFALLLEETSGDSAARSVEVARRQDVVAYALMQEDGKSRVFVGAFETAGQALWYAAELRSLGYTPALAYRTGRMF